MKIAKRFSSFINILNYDNEYDFIHQDDIELAPKFDEVLLLADSMLAVYFSQDQQKKPQIIKLYFSYSVILYESKEIKDQFILQLYQQQMNPQLWGHCFQFYTILPYQIQQAKDIMKYVHQFYQLTQKYLDDSAFCIANIMVEVINTFNQNKNSFVLSPVTQQLPQLNQLMKNNPVLSQLDIQPSAPSTLKFPQAQFQKHKPQEERLEVFNNLKKKFIPKKTTIYESEAIEEEDLSEHQKVIEQEQNQKKVQEDRHEVDYDEDWNEAKIYYKDQIGMHHYDYLILIDFTLPKGVQGIIQFAASIYDVKAGRAIGGLFHRYVSIEGRIDIKVLKECCIRFEEYDRNRISLRQVISEFEQYVFTRNKLKNHIVVTLGDYEMKYNFFKDCVRQNIEIPKIFKNILCIFQEWQKFTNSNDYRIISILREVNISRKYDNNSRFNVMRNVDMMVDIVDYMHRNKHSWTKDNVK